MTSLDCFKITFSIENKIELADSFKDTNAKFYYVTIRLQEESAFEHAEHNGNDHRFNKEKKLTRKDCVISFCKRQNSTTGFNKVQVTRFLNNLCAFKKYNFSPNAIFKVGGSGISTVPNKLPNVAAEKHKRLVGKTISTGHEQLVTILALQAFMLLQP
jgi:hypothetical protein